MMGNFLSQENLPKICLTEPIFNYNYFLMIKKEYQLIKFKVISDSVNELIKRYKNGTELNVRVIKKMMQKIARKH